VDGSNLLPFFFPFLVWAYVSSFVLLATLTCIIFLRFLFLHWSFFLDFWMFFDLMNDDSVVVWWG
jgi:hypothetical protein